MANIRKLSPHRGESIAKKIWVHLLNNQGRWILSTKIEDLLWPGHNGETVGRRFRELRERIQPHGWTILCHKSRRCLCKTADAPAMIGRLDKQLAGRHNA
jgi:hypothetical protein